MPLRSLFAVALLAGGGLAWWWLNGERTTTSADSRGEKIAIASGDSDSSAPGPAFKGETVDVSKLRRRVDDLKLALQSVVTERENLEGQLQQAEREVTRLERFVEEIEERGEDPVDYADQGLAMFQPAFDAYQSAFDRLELAESLEQTTAEELAAAERELQRILAE
jgi:Rad3-related DNA helicase